MVVRKMKKFNYSNLKNKTWDIKIINYLTQIHEEKGKQQLFLKQKTRGNIKTNRYYLRQFKSSMLC